jgi:transcriptional regulator with XRE-family HTH domain
MVLRRKDATKVSEGSPTVRRRELATRLRELRTASGLTVEQVAEKLFCSPSKISRLETGHRGVSKRDIRDLCELYRVDAAERYYLAMLVEEGARPAWWQPYDLPYATYVGLESAAIMISDFEPGVFPGLLQTPSYARAIHEGALPRLSPEVIDQRIEVRRTRQQVLMRDEPPRLSAIIDEAVLHRGVGGPEVMAEQLAYVIEVSRRDNITVQVLPYSAGAHPALDSTFILLEFAPPVPSVVYVEGLVGQIYLERAQDVERYRHIYSHLAAIGMNSQKSVELMAKTRAGLVSN